MTTVRQRIGLYRRVSTRHQLDNDRYLRALEDMTSVMSRHDAGVVIYDEGGHAHSGGTIRGRKVFMAMLADVASGDLDGIAAPDVRSLSRGEWLIDGKTIADTLIKAGALLFTRYSRLDLRNHGDLKAFQDELYYAMKEKDEIRQRFYEGIAARGLNVTEDKEEPWGRHRTMLGHTLVAVLDANGQPRITARGQLKRKLAKDPLKAEPMARLIAELETQPTRGALFKALYAAGVVGPDKSMDGGWTKRSLGMLLRSPEHQGAWKLVRKPVANIWYGLDPRSANFDASMVKAPAAHLAYWTPAQAKRWEDKFMDDDDTTRRTRTVHEHTLLGLLRCPKCHTLLVGKGKFGYVCPNGVRKSRAEGCFFTVRESTTHLVLRALLPLIEPRLAELRQAARDSLTRRNTRGHEVELQSLDNEERAMLAQLQQLATAGVAIPQSFTDRLVELGKERQRIQAEQDASEQVAQARIEAEQAVAEIPDGVLTAGLAKFSNLALAELYRAFFEWVEIRPFGPGRVGGELLRWKFHNEEVSGHLLTVDHLARWLAAA